MKLVLSDFLGSGILFQLGSGLLASGPSLQGGFFQQQLFQVIGGIEIGLVTRGPKHRFDFSTLESFEVEISKERVADETLP